MGAGKGDGCECLTQFLETSGTEGKLLHLGHRVWRLRNWRWATAIDRGGVNKMTRSSTMNR